MSAAYAALERAAAELKPRGFLARFETDLTKHDREWCERNPKVPFVWLAYSCGTHLARIEEGSKYGSQSNGDFTFWDARHAVRRIRDIGENFDPQMAWFVWDGCCLTRYHSATAVIAYLTNEERAA